MDYLVFNIKKILLEENYNEVINAIEDELIESFFYLIAELSV